MTEERKAELALDGIVHNIVSECRDIIVDDTHVYAGIKKLEEMIKEYNIILIEYQKFH